ncbi:MAG: hypothetical protein KBB11_00605 [Bacteroidales bacterium]|nr:hypothetical protein [Bacteroidales bacterium]HOY38067.1 hypothetical protein [Bacteroidales bacterium]HQP03607.1 hypothetical protein [Bacteroidales bacterium]
MTRFPLIILIAIVSLWGISQAVAQQASVLTRLSADSLIIGEQIQFTIQYSGDNPDDVVFPVYNDTLTKGIFIVKQGDIIEGKTGSQPLFSRDYVITAFDTGTCYIPVVKLQVVFGTDTLELFSDSIKLLVKPYLLIDTVPRDTVFAENFGIVVFGKNNFANEISMAIPDSIARSVTEDQLKAMVDSVREQYIQQFASELYRTIGFRNDEDVKIISAGSDKTIFIVDNNSIVETHRIPGANDTVFIHQYDTVRKGQALFVTLKIMDISDELFKTPLTWAEFWWRVKMFLKHNWWWIALSLAAMALILYYFVFRKKGIKNIFRRIPPPEPPHIVALRELNRIRDEKKWQNGKTKEYYTELTDVLRKYFEGRFGVNAMEMTSDEILNAMSGFSVITETYMNQLKQVLITADAVKFAKAEPFFHENDMHLKNAFDIVEGTVEEQQPDKVKIQEAYIEVESEKGEESKNV